MATLMTQMPRMHLTKFTNPESDYYDDGDDDDDDVYRVEVSYEMLCNNDRDSCIQGGQN